MNQFLQSKYLTDPRTNDNYELLDYIGEGTFSVVQRARLLKKGLTTTTTNNNNDALHSIAASSLTVTNNFKHSKNANSTKSINSTSNITTTNNNNNTTNTTSNATFNSSAALIATSSSSNTTTDNNTINTTSSTETDANTSPETFVALKRIYPNSSPDRILKELRHLHAMGGRHNVVKLLGGFRDQTSFTAVFPYFEHDDFKWYMPRMDTEMLRNYLRGLFKALKHVHKNAIIHRDIKPRNYLYSYQRNEGMLIDFGLAQNREDWEPALRRRRGMKWNGSQLVSIHSANSHASSSMHVSNNRVAGTNGSSSNGVGSSSSSSSSSNNYSTSGRNSLKRARTSNTTNTHSNSNSNLSIGTSTSGNGSNGNVGTVGSVGSVGNGSNQRRRMNHHHKKTVKIKAERAGTPGFRAPEVLLMSLEQTPAIDIWSTGVILLSLLSARYPVFPGPPRGHAKINSDAHALAQLEALLGRETLERAARSCHKQILESPTDKVTRNPPPSLRELCERGRRTYFEGVVPNRTTTSALVAAEPVASSVSSTSGSSSSSSSTSSSSSAEMLVGTCVSPNDLVKQIAFPADAYDLLERCLEVDSMKRISAKEALTHPFLCLKGK